MVGGLFTLPEIISLTVNLKLLDETQILLLEHDDYLVCF